MHFHSTFDEGLRNIARTFLAEDHVDISIGLVGRINPNLTQQVVWVEHGEKRRTLYDISIAPPPAVSAISFELFAVLEPSSKCCKCRCCGERVEYRLRRAFDPTVWEGRELERKFGLAVTERQLS